MTDIVHRRIWIKSRQEPLHCVNGHKIGRETVVLEQGAIRCTAKMNAGAGDRPTECGELYWVWAGGGFRVIARITHEELREIEKRDMAPDDVQKFLNLHGPMLPLGTSHALDMRPSDGGHFTLEHDRRRRA